MTKINSYDDFEEIKKEVERLEKMFQDEENYEDKTPDEIFKSFGLDLSQFEHDFENHDNKIQLGYKVIHNSSTEPKYNYETDSGFDLHSVEDMVIVPPFGRGLIPTGLCFDIPFGYEIQVRPKSGLALNYGLTVLNTPGTADCGYTGEIKVIVFNTTPEEFKIPKGMKVAQAVLSPVINGKWVELTKVEVINKKDRGSAGFGSTGI